MAMITHKLQIGAHNALHSELPPISLAIGRANVEFVRIPEYRNHGMWQPRSNCSFRGSTATDAGGSK